MSKCRGFEIQTSEQLGRIVIAKRDYRVGDVILDEQPLLISPYLTEDNTFECVGCYKSLTPECLHTCSRCKWPTCSPECELESFHAKYECPLFEEKNIEVSSEAYENLYILRAVLMCRDEENLVHWENFSNLDHSDDVAKRKAKIEKVTLVFRNIFQINVDSELLSQISGVYNVNGFEMKGEDGIGNSYKAQAIYYQGSMFSHSCAPNCEWVILPVNYKGITKRHLRIYARRDILCGETTNVTYIGECFGMDATARSSLISQSARFDCKCSRCSDPTEFSFYTEGIKCYSCEDKTMTAYDSSDGFSNWTCNQCGECKDYRYAKKCVESVHSSFIWSSLSQKGLEMSYIEKCGLNKNHRKIIFATYAWIGECNKTQFEELLQNSTGCDESFVKFMKIITQCRKIFGLFGSVLAILQLEWWFAQIIAAFYFKTDDMLSTPFDPYLPQEKLIILTAICDHLKIANCIQEWFITDYIIIMTDVHNFWNDELSALKELHDVAMSHSSDKLSFKVVEVTNKTAESKISPSELTEAITRASHEERELSTKVVERKKVVVSQSWNLEHSNVITSSWDSNLNRIKPSVSLLKKYDFYFDASVINPN